jgi:pimeloyl-ACP methyl ester carboxylesterase
MNVTACRTIRIALLALALVSISAAARAESVCDPDGEQDSGSIYRICMPSSGYNGILVIWAHGFQHTGTPVGIPEDQLCLGDDFCLNEIVNDLGFAFATNSYSKTGMAIRQGQADILDLVSIFAQEKGAPSKVYLVGASEGGIITALSVEQRPDVFSAGLAACGPVGDFPTQINYFGNARATFQYFFPTLIPGDPFQPSDELIAKWPDYYEDVVRPAVFAPASRSALDQWVRVAGLPFDATNYLDTVEVSVKDVLLYSVVDINDAAETMGGFPFENRFKWYTGSDNDFLLNLFVPRRGADASAIAEMKAHYNTTGALTRPLITLHTLRDQQVPYVHEPLYNLKTLLTGSLFTRHLSIAIDRFEHCNFTPDEALFSFAVMLLYDGLLQEVSGTAAVLTAPQQTAFETYARKVGLPTRRNGTKLTFTLKGQ